MRKLVSETISRALRTPEKIRKILNDDSLNAPACFHRVEAVVKILESNGIETTRHDWWARK
ncbi:hypothetical protein [uncultured Oscillibacter sp.]|uniref:hypothetical protein n=1 Tax=uncultured Oscillibacter sp. TaxID=876091 RepID=UPI00260D6382|nr:hypothetical protein [uncultured Oscillibacter sp.]